MTRSATLFALVTISLWSFLAYLASRLTHLPPFLVVGIALCIGGLIGIYQFRNWRVPLKTFLVGLAGLFGYHFLLFTAFQYAPTVEANSINYLWPLLIVLLSPVYLPGYRLKPHHIIGALIGLAGAGLVISGGHLSLDMANLKGYLLAGAAALVWASYSLLTKRLPTFPTAAVGGFCLASGIISLGFFGLSSLNSAQSPVSLSLQDWFFLILIGLGPMGIAFFTWDAALKRGDPRIIGSLTYVTPFCSTLVLVLLGGRSLSWVAGVAILLIVSGAVVGSLDTIRFKTKQPATL
ncbi:MAG: EamA family transporter [Anaerolineaceae bacterium]|nr:EamA family transporter [Anaerolineaceae bacterium]